MRVKQSGLRSYVVGILLALLGVLVVEGFFFPDILGVSMVPMGVFGIALWFDTYRSSRKKHTRVIHS